MAFDPDAYLAKKQQPSAGSGFDPDAYLEKKRQASKESPSVAESAARGAAQGASFGFIDEVTGGAQAFADDIKRGISADAPVAKYDNFGRITNLDEINRGGTYEKRRDESRAAYKEAQKANPVAYGAGEIVGGVASGIAIPGGSANTLKSAMKTGAAFGAAQGAGSSEADSLGGVLRDSATGALVGAGGGAVGYGAIKAGGAVADKVRPVIEKGKTYLGENFKNIGELAAFKSSGATLKDWRAARKTGEANKVGRFMLDSELKVGDTVDDVAEKFAARKESAGKKIGEIYDDVGEKFKDVIDKVGFDPKRDKGELLAAARKELGDTEGSEAAVNRLSKYLDEVAERHGDKPNEAAQAAYKKEVEAYLPKMRDFMRSRAEYRKSVGAIADEPGQGALPGMVDDLQRTGTAAEKVRLQGEIPRYAEADLPVNYAKTGQMSLMDDTQPTLRRQYFAKKGVVDRAGGDAQPTLSGLGDDLQRTRMESQQVELQGRTPTFADAERTIVDQGRGQTRMNMAPEAPARPVRPNEVRNPMAPGRTNQIKGALDERIKYSRNPMMPDPAAERAFYAARTKLSEKIDNAIETIGDESILRELKAANREYGMSKRVSDMAQDRVNRESANKLFGLTDTIMGGAGLGYGGMTGDWETAVGVMAGKKALEKYGTTGIAIAADRVSKRLLRSPEVAKLAQVNPKAFQAVVINFARKAMETTERLQNVADSKKGTVPSEEKRAPSNFEAPKRGREKWASDGFDNISKHSPDLGVDRDSVMQDPKSKEMLVLASDLKPGSKAMNQLVAKLSNRLSKGRD